MSFKKILAVMLAAVTACSISASALTLDVAEAADENVSEVAVLAEGTAATTETLTISTDYTLENVNIVAANGPAIAIAEDKEVTLTVVGDNYVKGATGFAGIYVPETSTLTIVGDGTLTAVGGDAIEFKPDGAKSSNLQYNYSAGAGIGGNGSYFMSDRNFSSKWTEQEKALLYTEPLSGKEFLPISNANFGKITVSMGENGQIVAMGGDAVTNQGGGAGIGSGGSNPIVYLNIEKAKETGEKEYYSYNGEIVINSGNITAIGGSSDNSWGANSGAGIGAGCSSQAVADNNIDITIKGGTIVATGAMDAAAIGGGAHVQGGDITITGGNVTAVSGVETTTSGNGAGIGAGHMAYEGIIAIKGDAVVSATANGEAAGIGAGADTYYNNEDESTDELHCENVVFGGNATIEFDGGKTTFFTVEEGSNVEFSSDSAVCAIVNTDGVMIGLASSFDEAVSVINEFKNVDTIRLIKDVTVEETVVVEDTVTIDGAGFTLKGADVVEPEVHDETTVAVTPVAVADGAVVTFKNITVEGGKVINTAEYANENSYGVAGDGIVVTDATINVVDSTVKGGASGAKYTRSTGSAIVAANATVNVNNSTLEAGKPMRSGVIAWQLIETDNASKISLTDVKIYAEKSDYANSALISGMNGDDENIYGESFDVYLDGKISVFGRMLDLDHVNYVFGENISFAGNIDPALISNQITVIYEKVDVEGVEDTDEEADLYNIILRGNRNYINRLTTADLTFKLDSATAVKPVYEIIPVAPVKVTTDADYANRYMFSFDGVTQPDETANDIVIGQVKFTGYGEYTFSVDAAFNETNVVHATKTNDSIVKDFIVDGKTTGKGDLLIGNTIEATIEVPTRDLTINVSFPNSVEKNVADYQKMTVTVSGGDLANAVVIALGDAAQDVDLDEYEKSTAKYTVAVADGYTVTLTDVLTVNTTYNVTVEGAGYRTARYTVTMTDAKVLNFWNNVKDNAVEVEEGKASSAVTKNFLAGDIVADNNINIYDLSAVVSYFATEITDEADYDKYVKYDLNRDGKIDSKDVAYVLVSWGA